MMLLAEALTQLLRAWDTGRLKTLPEALLRDRIPVILIQILNRTLLAQTASGAWGFEERPETTAYGILTLVAIYSLPWLMPLRDIATFAARSGREFLDRSQASWTKPSYHWVEKVTYGSARLSEAYCLAATKVSQASYKWSNEMECLIDMPEEPVSKLVQLFSHLESFHNEPRWKLMASVLEGYAFLPQLKTVGRTILPEQKEAKNEYLAYIPCTWVIVNNHHHLSLSANMLWDMMVLTVCNFRVDEYMESVVAKLSNDRLELIKLLIHDLCSEEQTDIRATDVKHADNLEKAINRTQHLPSNPKVTADTTRTNGIESQLNATDDISTNVRERYTVSTLISVGAVLSHYVRAMLTYPGVRGASTSDHCDFRNALRNFLLSHVAQIADNLNFATQPSWEPSATPIFFSPRRSFYSWVHTTGAESVSCPFSFAFLTCLLGATSVPAQKPFQEPVDDCFGSIRQKYLAQELCTHLAVMSRLYNDFGSLNRDRIEANVNSINFPEFHRCLNQVDTCTETADYERKLKNELLKLAESERQSADMASETFLRDLEGTFEAGGRQRKENKVNAIKLFIGVTRLYADLYIARDLSNRIVGPSG